MEFPERFEDPKTQPEAVDKADLEQRVREANDERGTFRSYDMGRNGEIRTTTSGSDGLYPEARATLYGRSGEVRLLGTTRYSIEMDEVKIYPDRFQAVDVKTEDALLSEISEKGRAHGATKLSVWVEDERGDPQRWIQRNFFPTERAPGAQGVFWQKRL
jgi:hypothetical protein